MDIRLPNGTVIRGVPDGTSKEAIQKKAISSGLATAQDFGAPQEALTPQQLATSERVSAGVQQSPVGQQDLGIPQVDESGQPVGVEYNNAPNFTASEQLAGLGESALTLTTGLVGGTVGTIAGTLKGLGDVIASGEYGTQEGADRVEKAQQQYAALLTNMPETEAGQRQVKALGSMLGALPPIIGAAPAGALATPAKAAIATPGASAKVLASGATPKSLTRFMDGRAELRETLKAAQPDDVISIVDDIVKSGSDDAATQIRSILDNIEPQSGDKAITALTDAAKTTDDLPSRAAAIIKERQISASKGDAAGFRLEGEKLRADPVGRLAVKRGFPENEVQAVKSATPQTRAKQAQILARVKEGLGNSRAKSERPASAVVGRSLLERMESATGINRKAGSEVNAEALKMKGTKVSLDQPLAKFMDDLEGLGVTLTSKKGKPALDFETSSSLQGLPKASKPANMAFKRLMGGGRAGPNKGFDAYDAHTMKRWLDNIIKPADGTPANADVKRIVESLRRNINNEIRAKSEGYAKANDKFSETIKPINELRRLAGKNTDLAAGTADESLGSLSRRITSNAASGPQVAKVIKDLEDVANKYGGNFKDSIADQQQFLNALESKVGAQRGTSLMGQQQAAIEATGMASDVVRGDIIGAGAKTLKKVFGKEEKKAQADLIESIEALLRD